MEVLHQAVVDVMKVVSFDVAEVAGFASCCLIRYLACFVNDILVEVLLAV